MRNRLQIMYIPGAHGEDKGKGLSVAQYILFICKLESKYNEPIMNL